MNIESIMVAMFEFPLAACLGFILGCVIGFISIPFRRKSK